MAENFEQTPFTNTSNTSSKQSANHLHRRLIILQGSVGIAGLTKRIMSPEEMARAVMFLASNDATSVTGMDLDVTGEQLAR